MGQKNIPSLLLPGEIKEDFYLFAIISVSSPRLLALLTTAHNPERQHVSGFVKDMRSDEVLRRSIWALKQRCHELTKGFLGVD